MFFQRLTYLTRTTGYHFRLINMTTFRKKRLVWLKLLQIQISRWASSCLTITKEKNSKWKLERTCSSSFAYATRGHICSIGGRLGTFSQILRMQTEQTKDVFYMWQNYLNILHWLMLEKFSLSGVFTKTIKSTLHITVYCLKVIIGTSWYSNKKDFFPNLFLTVISINLSRVLFPTLCELFFWSEHGLSVFVSGYEYECR